MVLFWYGLTPFPHTIYRPVATETIYAWSIQASYDHTADSRQERLPPFSMKRCGHSKWLSLHVSRADVFLHESDRVQNVLADVLDREAQRPGLIAFFGNTSKAVALRHLFGLKAKQAGGNRGLGEVHLHVDPSTVNTERPLLLADTDISQRRAHVSDTQLDKCHATTSHLLLHPRSSDLIDVTSDLCCRLLYPFTDVFCLFATDLGGFRQVSRCIASWLETDNLQHLPVHACPKVVIVTDVSSSSPEYEKNAKTTFLWFLEQETDKDVSSFLSSIEVVAIAPEGTVSPLSRYRRLKERLLDGCDQVRRCRAEASMLFSATHLAALLHSACEHFCQGGATPFNFIKASRIQNPVPEELIEHVCTFLDHTPPGELDSFATQTLGSSFFLDSYPPGSHSKSKFSPDHRSC